MIDAKKPEKAVRTAQREHDNFDRRAIGLAYSFRKLGTTKTILYVDSKDLGLPISNGNIIKITAELVPESETFPQPGEPGYDVWLAHHQTV